MSTVVHYSYQAVCYFPFLAIMAVVLLYSPALALFPRLTKTPFLFSSVPVLSLGILSGLGFLLFHLGYYTHSIVLSISLLFFAVAIIRQILFYRDQKYGWEKNDKSLLLINFFILMPLIAISGLSAFMTDDALVSWNYWAKHYFHLVSPAPISMGYPLVFPYFLSYCYQFLGTTEFQGAVKALLVFIPFSLLNIYAFRYSKRTPFLLIYFFVALISIFPGFLDFSFYRFYSVGYVDPLLAVAITLSAVFLLNYCQEEKSGEKKLLLVVAVITGMTAGLVKQPGFLWVFLGFPAILLSKAIKNRSIDFVEIIAIVFVIVPALLWILGPGKHFEHNMGVINASLGTSQVTFLALIKTLWNSILKYWVYQPSLLLLYALTLLSLKNIYQKIFFSLFILPGTLLWFVFGAYDVREGLYLLTCCGFLVMSRVEESSQANLDKMRNIFVIGGILLFCFFSVREQNVQHNGVEDHLYPLNASKTLIYHYFSEGAPFVYQEIYQKPSEKIWSVNYFANGIFFGNNPLIFPGSFGEDVSQVYGEILKTKPDYLITAGKYHSNASDAIIAINKRCPSLFEEIPLGDPLYQIKLFRLKDDPAEMQSCAKRLS